MSRGDNTQGTGGAGTGTGSGGSGSGTGNGGAGTGSGRTGVVLGALLGVVVIGVALAVAPLTDRWVDPGTRPAAYLLALLAVYTVCMHAVMRPGR